MYHEISPGKQFEYSVECFWSSQSTGESSSGYRVLPDGCADLIFDLTPGREGAYWVGTMTKALVVEGRGPQNLFGIRFHPGGAKGLLGIPLNQLTDERISFQEVTPFVEPVLHEILDGNLPPEKAVQHWLGRSVRQDARLHLVQDIFQRIKESPGNARVGEIADSLGLSRQYLNRVMQDCVGVDLKTFSRVLRMRTCVESLRGSATEIDWSDVAADFGFYDQSHLIHEFNSLVGLSPNQYFRR